MATTFFTVSTIFIDLTMLSISLPCVQLEQFPNIECYSQTSSKGIKKSVCGSLVGVGSSQKVYSEPLV